MNPPPTQAAEPVALRLLDREFLIACAPEEREGLLAAISVTHEYLGLRKQHDGADRSVTDGLAALRRKLEAALEPPVR